MVNLAVKVIMRYTCMMMLMEGCRVCLVGRVPLPRLEMPILCNRGRSRGKILCRHLSRCPTMAVLCSSTRQLGLYRRTRMAPLNTAMVRRVRMCMSGRRAEAGDCTEGNGCTRLISSGTDEHFSILLGASRDGSNAFFATFAALVPQDTDTQPDIYDARIDGGFPAPTAPARCAGESCRLIPSASPVISTPLSATFSGVGNLATVTPMTSPGSKKTTTKTVTCKKGLVKKHHKCSKRKKATKAIRGAGR